MVKNYARKIQPLLDDISASGNVILFQKQAIVTNTQDITPQVAEALFKDYLPNISADRNARKNANGNDNINSNLNPSQYDNETEE